MKNSAKTFLSLILTLAMLMSICVLPAMAYPMDKNGLEVEGDNGLYVYIGDSMTYDFVGSHNGYLPSLDIYGWQAARAMGYATDDYGKFPGGRATDAYAALSTEYLGDDYGLTELNTSDNGDKYLTGSKAERFQNAVREAKAVSVQVGYSEITTFFFANLINYLDEGEMEYSCDLSQIFSQEELEKIMPFVSKSMKLMDSIIPDGTRVALAQFLSQLSDAEKDALISVIGQEAFDTLSGVKATADAIKELFVYTMSSAIVHFDALVREIYKLNPDVELYVMGLVNPVSQLRLGFELNGKDYSIPLGDLTGGFFTVMNSYYRVFSPYSDKYYFVENIHHANTYAEAMVNDEELTAAILYALYNTNPTLIYNPVTDDYEYCPRNGFSDDQAFARNEKAYQKAWEQAPGVMQSIGNTSMFDLPKIIKGLIDGEGLDTSENALAKVAQYDADGNTTASYLEQLGANIAMAGILKGIYVHPTQAGHDAEAPLLIAAMKNPQVDPLAIAYHKLVSPMEKTVEALDNSTTIDEFTDWVESIKDIWQEDPPADPGDDDDDSGDQGDVPPAPQPTVLEKVGNVMKNIVKTVSTTVKAVFTKLGSLFR